MMDECTTPYYVRVNEDMLYPNAIRVLYEWISTMDAKVALYVGGLYDAHLEEVIHGIKITRRGGFLCFDRHPSGFFVELCRTCFVLRVVKGGVRSTHVDAK